MNTILVPLDGSLLAERVLPYVRVLAPLLDSHVHLLRILDTSDDEASMLDSLLGHDTSPAYLQRRQTTLDEENTRATDYLESQAVALRDAGLNVIVDARIGDPADVIVEVAASQQVGMIVMATHGYSGLRRWTLGSVAEKVVRATETPVFVIRASDDPLPDPITLKRIMITLDGSAFARQALPIAARLATETAGELLLLSVIAPPVWEAPESLGVGPNFDAALEAVQERLPQEIGPLADELSQRGVPITPLAASGFAADTIVDEAQRQHADLIVMATHGYTGLRQWRLGSVATKVLHATHTPLLLVHAREP